MTLWMVRAGKHGERESLALEQNIAVIGWEDLPDLSNIKTRDALSKLLKETYPDNKPKTLKNWESQIWPFIREMKQNDLVALPLKSRSSIAIGRVVGDYTYRPDLPPDAKHTRPVKWMEEYPRTAFDQDLLYSLGAFMTVCRISRNNAEERVRELILGRKPRMPPVEGTDGEEEIAQLDIEQYARDQIREYISRKFRGHSLATLVAAILTAQGYQAHVSPEGADGGVDIIAGKGPLGFDPPRLAVQVKSSDSPVSINILRELQGTIENFNAEQGLLVTWGGYKASIAKETARQFFKIRIWDAEDLVRMVQTYYEQLPDVIQAELPLKRIWALVQSEE